jgi:hypothetical protein
MLGPARSRIRAHMAKTFGADTFFVEIHFAAYSENSFQRLWL